MLLSESEQRIKC